RHLVSDTNRVKIDFKHLALEFCAIIGSYDDDRRLKKNSDPFQKRYDHNWIMATTIEQQTALDESLVPSSQRLRIGRCNFRLPSDIQSKEATLQVVYDVLRNSPLFMAFQVTADVPEIYMQEFWATAKLHHTSIRFKIDTKKSVLNLEAFREMLHVSPRIPNQPFADLPTEEEVLDFLRINIDFAYLIWEDFVYQVEHKSQKRSNEMNYPRFTKVIIDYFMTRKPSISRRNRIHWHYVRDDALFSTIKVKELVLNQGFRMYHLMILRKNFSGNLLKMRNEEEKVTSEEEDVSFDPIPRTPEDSEKESDDEEEQESRLSEEQEYMKKKMQKTYIVTDEGVESIFAMTSSQSVSLNLPTFNSAFRFEERLRLLETSFNEYRQTNQVAGAVSAILGIVHQYMDQQMKEAVQEAVQQQTAQLQDLLQRENDEFLRNIDENMKN
nr:hypothetical protein [Tanacetum cinerariifolium]